MQSISNIRVKFEARFIVDTFDELMLHSEKVRRTMIRVRTRSNHHRKREGLAMLKAFIRLRHHKRVNKIKSDCFQKDLQMKIAKKCIHAI